MRARFWLSATPDRGTSASRGIRLRHGSAMQWQKREERRGTKKAELSIGPRCEMSLHLLRRLHLKSRPKSQKLWESYGVIVPVVLKNRNDSDEMCASQVSAAPPALDPRDQALRQRHERSAGYGAKDGWRTFVPFPVE